MNTITITSAKQDGTEENLTYIDPAAARQAWMTAIRSIAKGALTRAVMTEYDPADNIVGQWKEGVA